jgi:hypothetical protein
MAGKDHDRGVWEMASGAALRARAISASRSIVALTFRADPRAQIITRADAATTRTVTKSERGSVLTTAATIRGRKAGRVGIVARRYPRTRQ